MVMGMTQVESTQKKHTRTLNKKSDIKSAEMDKKVNCGECQASCQSACKTSCTVANQVCENK